MSDSKPTASVNASTYPIKGGNDKGRAEPAGCEKSGPSRGNPGGSAGGDTKPEKTFGNS